MPPKRTVPRVRYQVAVSSDNRQVVIRSGGDTARSRARRRSSVELPPVTHDVDSVQSDTPPASPRSARGVDTSPIHHALLVRRESAVRPVSPRLVGEGASKEIASINVELQNIEEETVVYERRYRQSLANITATGGADANANDNGSAASGAGGDIGGGAASRHNGMLHGVLPGTNLSRRSSNAGSLRRESPIVSFNELATVTSIGTRARPLSSKTRPSVFDGRGGGESAASSLNTPVPAERRGETGDNSGEDTARSGGGGSGESVAERERKDQHGMIKELNRAYESKAQELKLVLAREANVQTKTRRRIEELQVDVDKVTKRLEKEEENHAKSRLDLQKSRAQNETSVKTAKFRLITEFAGVVRLMEKNPHDKTIASQWLAKKQDGLDDDALDAMAQDAAGGVNALYAERLKRQLEIKEEERQNLLSELADKDKRIEIINEKLDAAKEAMATMVPKSTMSDLVDQVRPVLGQVKGFKNWATAEITNARTDIFETLTARMHDGVAAHAAAVEAREADLEAQIATLTAEANKSKEYEQLIAAFHEKYNNMLDGLDLPSRKAGSFSVEDRLHVAQYEGLTDGAPRWLNIDLQHMYELVQRYITEMKSIQKYKDQIKDLEKKLADALARNEKLAEDLAEAEGRLAELEVALKEAEAANKDLTAQLEKAKRLLAAANKKVAAVLDRAAAAAAAGAARAAGDAGGDDVVPVAPAAEALEDDESDFSDSMNHAGNVRALCDQLLKRANGLDNPDEMTFTITKLRSLDTEITRGAVAAAAAEVELNLIDEMLSMFAQRTANGDLRVDGNDMGRPNGGVFIDSTNPIAAILGGDETAATLEEFLQGRKDRWVQKIRAMYKKQTEFLETVRRLVEVEIEAARAVGRDPEHIEFLQKKLAVVDAMVKLSLARATTPAQELNARNGSGRNTGGKISGRRLQGPSLLSPLCRPYDGCDSKVRAAATIVYQSCLQPANMNGALPVNGVCPKKLEHVKTLDAVMVSAPREQEISPQPQVLGGSSGSNGGGGVAGGMLPSLPDGNWQTVHGGAAVLQGTHGQTPFGAARSVHAAMIEQFRQNQNQSRNPASGGGDANSGEGGERGLQLPVVGNPRSPPPDAARGGGKKVIIQEDASLSLVDLTIPPEALAARGGASGALSGSGDPTATTMKGSKARVGRHSAIRHSAGTPKSPTSTLSTRSTHTTLTSRGCGQTVGLPTLDSNADLDVSLDRAASALNGSARRASLARSSRHGSAAPQTLSPPQKIPPMLHERAHAQTGVGAPAKACFTLC